MSEFSLSDVLVPCSARAVLSVMLFALWKQGQDGRFFIFFNIIQQMLTLYFKKMTKFVETLKMLL